MGWLDNAATVLILGYVAVLALRTLASGNVRARLRRQARRFDALCNRVAYDDALFALFLLAFLALSLASSKVGTGLMLFLFVWGARPWRWRQLKDDEQDADDR